jgi:hypothetical protein
VLLYAWQFSHRLALHRKWALPLHYPEDQQPETWNCLCEEWSLLKLHVNFSCCFIDNKFLIQGKDQLFGVVHGNDRCFLWEWYETHTHTHTHTHIYIYIYIYICVCVYNVKQKFGFRSGIWMFTLVAVISSFYQEFRKKSVLILSVRRFPSSIWSQQVAPKCYYLCTKLRGVTCQKTVLVIFTSPQYEGIRQGFRKSGSHLKILRSRMVIWKNIDNEDPKI